MPSAVFAAAALAAPVPPWATLSGVDRPVRLVMSEFAPFLAAARFVRASLALVAPVPPLATEMG